MGGISDWQLQQGYMCDPEITGYSDREDDQEVTCSLVKETRKAYLFETDGERFWCPKSACHYDGHDTAVIAGWFDIKFLKKQNDFDSEFGEVK